MAVTIEQARAASHAAEQRYNQFAPVVSVGITRIGADFGIRIGLAREPEGGGRPPSHIDGVPIEVLVTGPIHALRD